MANKLVVSPSPHIKDNATTQKLMRDVVIALLPAALAGTLIFGIRALIMIAFCVISSVGLEYLFARVTNRKDTVSDFSAVITGMLIAFNVPVTLPLWMAFTGCFFAIVIVKQVFGGIGKNFANPAIVGRIFLMIAFAGPMASWVVPNGNELVAGATPLAMINSGQYVPIQDLFMGTIGGCLGETSAFALILGGAYLILKRVISPTIPFVYIGTVGIMALALGADPIAHIFAGGLILGAFFMATDYTTSPVTEKGRVIFAIGCGILTIVIRLYGSYAEGVSFAILIMNILTPHIDKLTRTKPLGGVK